MTQRTSLACAGMLVALAACGDAPDSLRLTSASPEGARKASSASGDATLYPRWNPYVRTTPGVEA